MRNRDQLKTPKIFSVKMVRNADGSFHLLGNTGEVYIRTNQYKGDWVPVDIRDLAVEMNNSKIRSF